MSQSGVLDVINSSPTIPTTFDTDSGSAIPVANVLDILGTQGITTSGAGKAVTVTGVLATAGATVGASTIGVAAFDSTSFTVTAGFVQLSGAGLAIDEILLDSGAQIPPTGAGLIKFNGNTAAAGSTPVQTLSTEANQFQLDVQRAATSVGTDDTAQGLASFDSTVFTVDANGYVTITGPLPVANGGTGASTLTGVLTGNGTSAITANAVTEYGVLIGGASNAVASTAVGTANDILTSNGAGVPPTFQTPASGTVVQSASTSSGTLISSTTIIPPDDTIPQITEGASALTLSYTALDTANIIRVEVTGYCYCLTTNSIGALFIQPTADAFAAAYIASTNVVSSFSLVGEIVAGSVSSQTFEFRFGPQTAATSVVNGIGAGNYFGTTGKVIMRITEMLP